METQATVVEDVVVESAKARPRMSWTPGEGYAADGTFSPQGPVRVATVEEPWGTKVWLHGLKKAYATEAEAIAAGDAHALKIVADRRRAQALHARWDRTAIRMAPENRRQGLGAFEFNVERKAVEGEIVKVWAHGGYRRAVVVETTKGKGVTVVYSTPSSPADVHLTRTTKYAQVAGEEAPLAREAR